MFRKIDKARKEPEEKGKLKAMQLLSEKKPML
jgi:hypothetical protein